MERSARFRPAQAKEKTKTLSVCLGKRGVYGGFPKENRKFAFFQRAEFHSVGLYSLIAVIPIYSVAGGTLRL